jgi:hypothetical protein
MCTERVRIFDTGRPFSSTSSDRETFEKLKQSSEALYEKNYKLLHYQIVITSAFLFLRNELLSLYIFYILNLVALPVPRSRSSPNARKMDARGPQTSIFFTQWSQRNYVKKYFNSYSIVSYDKYLSGADNA